MVVPSSAVATGVVTVQEPSAAQAVTVPSGDTSVRGLPSAPKVVTISPGVASQQSSVASHVASRPSSSVMESTVPSAATSTCEPSGL